MPPKVAFFYSRIRVEEKLLIDALKKQSFDADLIDVRKIVLDPHNTEPWKKYDLVIDRCIAHNQAIALIPVIEAMGVRCINSSSVTKLCGNKIETSLALVRNNVSTLPIKVAATPEAALEAIESLGYPAVLKPVVGSWGRLLAKVNDRDAAEAVLEHKATLGSVQHQTFYIQPFVEKAKFDIRSFVVGGETICAIKRFSDHWITNTARGATTENYPLTDELISVSNQAAAAVGGGVLAVDLFETADGYVVNEVNSTMEFRNSIDVTGVDIPARVVEFLQRAVDNPDDLAPVAEVESA